MPLNEPSPSALQRNLLHGALKDIHYAREKLKGVKLMQRYGGQPALVDAVDAVNAHLSRLWHLLDGLDVKSDVAGPPSA